MLRVRLTAVLLRLGLRPAPTAYRGRAGRLGRSRSTGLLALVLIALGAIQGCSGLSGARDGAEAPDRVFMAGLQEIADLYIDPVDIGEVAVAGLDGLKSIDPEISARRDGPRVVVLSVDRALSAPEAPAPRDARAWAAVMTQSIEAMRSGSPKIAAASHEDVYEAAFNAIAKRLDRFSRYSSAEAARDQRASRDGFGGIGVTINAESGAVTVVAVISEGPAGDAGVKAEDRIVAIDRVSTSGMTIRDVVKRLRGPLDTPVEITVRRPGAAEPLVFRITRARIVVPTIKVERIGPIAHLRVMSFNQQTGRKLSEALEMLQADRANPPKGLILDLRSNPGGLLDQAVRVADAFLTEGPIVSTRGRHPASNQSFEAGSRDLASGLPIVVLVNGASASAAEIVAAALQDRGRGVVIGASSFGKGTVQTVMRLPNEGELTLTWARLHSPAGYGLHLHGVIPTICTNGLSTDNAGLRQGLRNGAQAVASGGLAARPRAQLDEDGWKSLRASCVSPTADSDNDVQLAAKLLHDPTLYVRALRLATASVSPARPMAALPHPHR